jgi:hypothetical protein
MTPKVLPSSARVAPANGESITLQGFFGIFRYSRRAIELVWSTNRGLTLALALLTLIAGVLPASVAYVGSLIVDAVVTAIRAGGGDLLRSRAHSLPPSLLLSAACRCASRCCARSSGSGST